MTGRRPEGDAAGHRSLADQDTEELGGRLSVLVRQKADHVRLDHLLHRLETAAPQQEDDVLRAIYRLVFPHAFADESVLWPVIRRVLPDGEALTLEVEQEHQEVNELVSTLEHLPPGSPARPGVLDRLAEVLREDVRDEEDVLLPRLQEKLSRQQLVALGLAWEAARRISPTRAHPVVARRPPGNVLAALPLTVVDRVRDRVDATTTPGAEDQPAGRLARTLRTVSHRLEHLPGLTRGEDASTSTRP